MIALSTRSRCDECGRGAVVERAGFFFCESHTPSEFLIPSLSKSSGGDAPAATLAPVVVGATISNPCRQTPCPQDTAADAPAIASAALSFPSAAVSTAAAVAVASNFAPKAPDAAANSFSSCGPEEREGASCDREATCGGSNPRRESGRRDGKDMRARVGVAPGPHDSSIPEAGPCGFDFQPDFEAMFDAIMSAPIGGGA